MGALGAIQGMHLRQHHAQTDSSGYFRQAGGRQALRLRHGKDAAHAAAPLLRQMQLTEHAGNHWVADA